MLVEQIDTRQGTNNSPEFSHGNCLPATGMPWGMNYFAVENRPTSWYFDPAKPYLNGIRLTHLASPWGRDYCALTMLPFGNDESLTTASYELSDAEFHPNRLHVHSVAGEWDCELVPSQYGAQLQIQGHGLRLSFPDAGQLTQIDAYTIQGQTAKAEPYHAHPLTIYITLKFTQGVEMHADGDAWVVNVIAGDHFQVDLGTSFIGFEASMRNLPQTDYADTLAEATRQWNEKLARIEITHHDPDTVATFYHNLWRTTLYPQRCWEPDANGQPVHYDVYADTVKPGYLYMNTGFWDTSRTLFPLLTLIDQPALQMMMQGFLNSYRESGYLPKWLSPEETGGMPGTLFDTVIADLAVKGLDLDDMPEFLEGMIHSAEDQSTIPNYGRNYIDDYKKYGYVPTRNNEAINHTLDYAYSDFAISQVAKVLGKPVLQHKYWQRSKNYRHLVDPARNFVVGKDTNGNFRTTFDPLRWGSDYTEGNAWQESYMVYHDIVGLRQSFSSPEAFDQQLTTLCNQLPGYRVGSYGFVIHEMRETEALKCGQVNLGNQPSFHLPYLFAFIHRSWAMQPMLKRMMLQAYSAGVNGFPGDEDNGSMSAWYVFNALGMYPFCPGTGEYVLGIPLFDQASVHLAHGKTLRITAEQNDVQHQFVDHVAFNDQPYRRCFVTHAELSAGGELAFGLGVVPNLQCYDDEVPFSVTTAEKSDR